MKDIGQLEFCHILKLNIVHQTKSFLIQPQSLDFNLC